MIYLERTDYDRTNGVSQPQPLEGYGIHVEFAADGEGAPVLRETCIDFPKKIAAVTKGRLITPEDFASLENYQDFCEKELVALGIDAAYPVQLSLQDEILILSAYVTDLSHILIHTIADWRDKAQFRASSPTDILMLDGKVLDTVDLTNMYYEDIRVSGVRVASGNNKRQAVDPHAPTIPAKRTWEDNFGRFRRGETFQPK